MNKLLKATMASVCLAAMTTSMAIAQTTPNANAPSARMHAQRFANRAFTRPTERVEAGLAYVKTALKITDAQQLQWDAYANFARKNAQEMEQRFQAMHASGREHSRDHRANAIERLERQQAFLSEASTRLSERLAVEKPLYAALSPEQQKVADVVLNSRSQSMHGHGGSRRG